MIDIASTSPHESYLQSNLPLRKHTNMLSGGAAILHLKRLARNPIAFLLSCWFGYMCIMQKKFSRCLGICDLNLSPKPSIFHLETQYGSRKIELKSWTCLSRDSNETMTKSLPSNLLLILSIDVHANVLMQSKKQSYSMFGIYSRQHTPKEIEHGVRPHAEEVNIDSCSIFMCHTS